MKILWLMAITQLIAITAATEEEPQFYTYAETSEGCPYVNEFGEEVYAIAGESYFDGCNRCICGTGGIAACTRKACKGCPYTNEEGDLVEARPRESYRVDCNTCFCGDEGLAMCTKMACPGCEYVNEDGNTVVARLWEIYEVGCNTCLCTDEGVPDCTEMYCGDDGCEYVDKAGQVVVANPGESFMDDCNTCMCGKGGVTACTLMACMDEALTLPPDGCKFVDAEGQTNIALPGDSFSDGCNDCVCQDDGTATCTKKVCLDKCQYKNWDMISGWAAGKTNVQVFDPKAHNGEGCIKKCKCRVKSRGKTKGNAFMDCRAFPCELPEIEIMGFKATCPYNMMEFMEDEVFFDRCEKCTCMSDGSINCVPTPCCLYIEDGETKRAAPGEVYNDGCNRCKCGSEGGMGACTRRGCPSKCSYKNYDMVMGYADEGSNGVNVFDEAEGDYGCHKVCKCVGHEIVCPGGMFSCLMDM